MSQLRQSTFSFSKACNSSSLVHSFLNVLDWIIRVDGVSVSILLFLWDDSVYACLCLIERWKMLKKNLVHLL